MNFEKYLNSIVMSWFNTLQACQTLLQNISIKELHLFHHATHKTAINLHSLF